VPSVVLAEVLLPFDDKHAKEDEWVFQHHVATAKAMAARTWSKRQDAKSMRRARAMESSSLTSAGTERRDKVRRIGTTGPSMATEDEDEFTLESRLVLPPPEDFAPPEEAEESPFANKLQIIFCSRTHSQLAQVLGEIKRVDAEHKPEHLTVVTLGARESLCVNNSVRSRARSGHAMHLNDLCRRAVERGKKEGGCTLKQRAQVMADHILTKLLDIEAMAQQGRAPVGGGCPYYGSRSAVAEADVLLVPYASLVNSDTRRKLGIRTEGNVLIFDEAHNLLEAISDANSVSLSAVQARNAVDELDAYISRYESRLAPRNSMRLKQLRQLCAHLNHYLASLQKSSAHTVGGFLVAAGADHFDLPILATFLEETDLARKVRGYSEAHSVSPNAAAASGSVYSIASLLAALSGSTGDDRLLCELSRDGGASGASLRYLSLDAEARFRDLITSARAVIFAGGTLEPRAEFAPLYSGVGAIVKGGTLAAENPLKVVHFAGRHVIPTSHVCARYITHGPGGHLLDFRKDSRGSAEQTGELRSIMAECAHSTPGGVIFFFPSFEYLGQIGIESGSRLGGREVFIETRRCASTSGAADRRSDAGESTLRTFAATVRRDGGAVLMAVSGGKLSEGIDFKDDLCRLVAVVGLPYPNASDLALLEKMRYLDSRRAKGDAGLSGKEFYSARCMKAVNQCIGRAIRHINDWAAVLLLDHRYANANINGSISHWLREQASQAVFVDAMRDLKSFFVQRGDKSEAIAAAGA